MKSTGITRRIDDLGRVVVPKEIRQTLNIKEGEPLEISVDTSAGMVCFQKIGPEEKTLTPKDVDGFFKKYIKENVNINDSYQVGFYNAVKYLWGEMSNYLENK